MFYANNEQVKGIFLNGRNYNYLAYGFGKIIPEDRNAVQLNLNLAYKYLNHYRIEFGTVKDGYENALVSPRVDKPDSNGIFHTPFTYYYNGNVISTKEVNVLVNNAHWALLNASVYSDININGKITYFATNTDFHGHNVNVFPEGEDEPIYKARLNQPILSNCTNFSFDIQTRFSKMDGYPSVDNCNNFSGNFRYVGNSDVKYPGFRGFLYECRDGSFNIDCTNMHGGGSDANVTNYYNFSGIQSCNNIKLNITGSSWQAWVHHGCYSGNCNITTRYIVPGFDRMNHCNFNIYLPSNANVKGSTGYSLLTNSRYCNYNLNALGSNLYNYVVTTFFDNLNNCNLNLLVNNAVRFSDGFGSNFINCNIVFDSVNCNLLTRNGWYNLYNCNITGNVKSTSSAQGFLERCYGLNVNLNFAESSKVLSMCRCNNIKGNIIAGNMTYVNSSSYMNLNVNNGNVMFNNIVYGNFNVHNAITQFCNVNNSNAWSKSKAYVSALNNCHNISIYSLNIVGGALIENVYDSFLAFNYGSVGRMFSTQRVNNCNIAGFPSSFTYTTNCRFDVGLEEAITRNSSYVTWANVWPHGFKVSESYRYLAGLRSVDNSMSSCSMSSTDMVFGGNKRFENNNNMQTSIDTFYNGTVIANLPNYNMNIKFNVDCNTLNLGVLQSGPPHGFQNATISADNIFCTTGKNYYVYMNYGTRIYCENFCNVCFRPFVPDSNSVPQSVLLINNYQHSNAYACHFFGGLTRIGRLNYNGNAAVPLELYNGACMFINNTRLGSTIVNNALLFLGSNVSVKGALNVTNGGLVVTKANYSMNAIGKFVNRNNFAWNFTDSGPWGSQSLLNYCLNV